MTQQLRALAHPLRLRLVEAFARGRRTTMQVAQQLGEPPTRLYHHVNALERAGILKLVETRQVRGSTEKYFEVARRRLGRVRGAQITGATRSTIGAAVGALFEEARGDLLAALAHPKALKAATAPLALRMIFALPPAQIARARRRLLAALKDIQRDARKCKPNEVAAQWALTVAFAPTQTGKKSRP